MDSATRRRVGRGEGETNVDANIYYDADDRKTRSSTRNCWLVLAAAGLCIVLAVVVIILLPCPIEPRAFSLPPPPEWTGPLAPNDKLSKSEKVFENQLIGPESIVRDGDYMYVSTADGKVVSISRGEITTLASFGKGTNCGSFDSEPTCGRPLGMRLDKEGYLLVLDGYLGLYRVNVATGDYHQLLSSQTPLAGRRPRLLNDLDLGPDGVIYFSDSSTKWDRRHNRYCALEGDNSGRLLSYDPTTGHVEELMSGLAFANGVSLSYDKTHILVAETTMARIWRYYIAGARKGEREVFVDNLPGLPDNIRQSGRGTYWVGMAVVRGAGRLSFLDLAAPRPWLRTLITKLMSQETIMKFLPKYGMIVELNKAGEITRALHDPSGEHSASEVAEKDGVLYLGSYHLPFLGRLYLHRT